MNKQGLYVSFRLAANDVGAIRFGISPGFELCQAAAAIQDPHRSPLLWGWLRGVRRAVDSEQFAIMAALIAPTGYFPDFLTSPPSPNARPEDEVEALRAVPLESIHADLTKLLKLAVGERRTRVLQLLDDPARARTVVADAWWSVWKSTLADHWEQIHRILAADIAHRSRAVVEVGTAGMVGSIHERVTWQPGMVRVRMRSWAEDVDCAGSGLLLVPSLLGAPYCAVLTEKPVQPTLFYPAHGVTDVWHRSGTALDSALAALLGDGRARILQCLDGPRSTSEAASLCSLAVSTASHHLAVLRDARLVSSTREGSRVMHTRTVLGDAFAR